MNFTDFLIITLAVWRVSSLLAYEEGPFDIFGKLRNISGVRYDEYSNPYGTNALSRGVLCVWCNSVWVGIAWAVLYVIAPKAAILISLPLALSALAIGWHELIEKVKTNA